MAEQFYTILTSVGKAKIANAVALGTTVQITQIAVGDGNGTYYNPSETQTALVNEVWRGNVSRVDTDPNNPNWIVVEAVIPPDVGGFYIREVGIFDSQGELIAIGKYPETYKPTFIANNTSKDLVIRAILEVSNASVVELKVDPTVVIATEKSVQDAIAGHDADATAHLDIRNALDTHLADTTAHNIPAQIDTHNADPNAHAVIINNHNTDPNAHDLVRIIPLKLPYPTTSSKWNIKYCDSSSGSVLAAFDDGTNYQFFRTIDDGQTWVNLAIFSGWPSTDNCKVWHLGDNVWLVVNNTQRIFFVSTDDGATWQQYNFPSLPDYSGVQFDPNYLVVVGASIYNGTIYWALNAKQLNTTNFYLVGAQSGLSSPDNMVPDLAVRPPGSWRNKLAFRALNSIALLSSNTEIWVAYKGTPDTVIYTLDYAVVRGGYAIYDFVNDLYLAYNAPTQTIQIIDKFLTPVETLSYAQSRAGGVLDTGSIIVREKYEFFTIIEPSGKRKRLDLYNSVISITRNGYVWESYVSVGGQNALVKIVGS